VQFGKKEWSAEGETVAHTREFTAIAQFGFAEAPREFLAQASNQRGATG
jgi:hypothetical protein